MRIELGTWKEAYEAQMMQWRHQRSPVGRRLLQRWVDLETGRQPTKRSVFEMLLPAEEHKLLTADPVFVTDEMVDLIEAARETWKPEPLVWADILIPTAWIYFERPMYMPDRRGRIVNVKAISYCAAFMTEGEHPTNQEPNGIAVSFYSSTDLAEVSEDSEVSDLAAIRDQLGIASKLTLLHCTPVWFNVDPAEEAIDVDTGAPTGAVSWWTLLQVTLRLMQQRISHKTRVQPDRPTRRRAKREGFDPMTEILVIHLRRDQIKGHDPETREVEWSHRWPVVGHWRAQWYPSLGLHRQVYIASYVKGPDDKPFVAKRRAYQLDR